MKAPQKTEEKTKSGYLIIKGSSKTEEDECHLLQFDGLSEPNPGESTGGAVLFSPSERKILFERGEYIKYATNNQAEYTGLLIGLQSAVKYGVKKLLIEGDSNLIISQTAGIWKVKHDGLKELNKEVRDIIVDNFDFVGIRHVFRENNKHADALTNEVIKTKVSFLRENKKEEKVEIKEVKINVREKIYLSVPFSQKDLAKAKGAKWDFNAKKWYVYTGDQCYEELFNMFPVKDLNKE